MLTATGSKRGELCEPALSCWEENWGGGGQRRMASTAKENAMWEEGVLLGNMLHAVVMILLGVVAANRVIPRNGDSGRPCLRTDTDAFVTNAKFCRQYYSKFPQPK